MSAPTLALIMYEQAQKALEYQERQVNELRQRTGTLLGAAALTASFLGATTLKHGGAGLPVALAGLALAVIVLSGLYVLYPHELDFTPDVRRVYDRLAPARHDPDRMLISLAFGLRAIRARNGEVVDRLTRALTAAVSALVVYIVCWTWALAVLWIP